MPRSLILISILLAAAAAPAQQSPLRGQWQKATGPLVHLGVIEVVHRVYDTDEDGMPGTREERDTQKLQRREIVTHEHDQTITVFDGKNGWRKDWNGFVEKLAGTDVQRQKDLAMIQTYAAIVGAGGPATPVGTDALRFG